MKRGVIWLYLVCATCVGRAQLHAIKLQPSRQTVRHSPLHLAVSFSFSTTTISVRRLSSSEPPFRRSPGQKQRR